MTSNATPASPDSGVDDDDSRAANQQKAEDFPASPSEGEAETPASDAPQQ